MTWIFFEEGKGDDPHFEIQASNHEEAYRIAYDSYGPQVDDLLYMKKPQPKCDAMGHFGAPPRHGICEKCNEPF